MARVSTPEFGIACISMCCKLSGANPSEPVSGRENPAVKAGLFRVYVTVNNYRTNFDDFLDMYLFGIQVDVCILARSVHEDS